MEWVAGGVALIIIATFLAATLRSPREPRPTVEPEGRDPAGGAGDGGG